jgi:hypothetical protein
VLKEQGLKKFYDFRQQNRALDRETRSGMLSDIR